MIEVDFQQVYGIDLSDPRVRQERTWRWFVVRVIGLLSTECRIQRVFNPVKPHKE